MNKMKFKKDNDVGKTQKVFTSRFSNILNKMNIQKMMSITYEKQTYNLDIIWYLNKEVRW